MYANNFSARALILAASLAAASSGASAQGAQALLPEELAAAQNAAQTQAVQPGAGAQLPAPSPVSQVPLRTRATAAAIAEINEKMSVMQAQLAELELEAKIAAKRAEISHSKNGGASQIDDGFTPTVLEIGGADGKLIASLMMPGSNVQTVRVGDTVGGWTVKRISVDALTLARGKDVKRLSFGSGPATPAPGVAAPLGSGIMGGAAPNQGMRLP